MNEKEILDQQVEALEKLLKLKQAIIDEQEAKINRLEAERFSQPFYPGIQQPQQPIPNIFIPSVWTHDPCPANNNGLHEYPNLWGGTTPSSCVKCGKLHPVSGVTITSGTSTNGSFVAKEEDSITNVTSITTAARK